MGSVPLGSCEFEDIYRIDAVCNCTVIHTNEHLSVLNTSCSFFQKICMLLNLDMRCPPKVESRWWPPR